ncbi:MAG: c-type cytochrome, partial [Prosthecobacter sp.]|nr:c-type cytochrome [Prosthecobacter sp.]
SLTPPLLLNHWPETVSTPATLSTSPDAFVVDEISLPVPNPWKRNIRLADLAFLNDQGDAAGVTFDGDAWLISGLKGDLEKVTWKRFASGLHEPMSIVSRQGELFVFDRSGIWKLADTNGDKEVDRYEMFCNLFAQTAETREFPNSMKLGPDGSLYIAKGGQEGSTYGKHNGTVIKIAPDGKSFEVIAYGLRQPFIGVNPKTGLVTASDQQGNYVPSTPIHIIKDNQFYGHLPTIAPKEIYPAPIAEPLTWIPHPVNPSGATQTWLVDAKMGPINDEMIHVGYNRPELFRVLMNTHFKRPQAAVMSFERDLDFGPLNAEVNPADGQLYVAGFQVWGTTAKKLSGLVRIRYTNKPRVLLKEVTPTDKGLLLRFNAKLNEKLATDPASYSAERWNYKRTFDYGSPHLKLDGSTGQEWLTASSAYLSKDGMSVLVGFPDMIAGVHQMRIGWGLESAEGLKAANTAYFSPWELAKFDAVKEGFGDITVDLTPRKAEAVVQAVPTVEEGAKLYQMIGCMACHSTDGSTVGKVGPSWRGIYGTERILGKGGKSVIADEAYLRESITNPSAKVVKGFEKFDTGMPIYAGILNESQIESLILYIKSLK